MQLHEKLKELIDHEVLLMTNQPEEEEAGVPGGIIKEIGEDYLVVHTASEEKGGFAKTGAEWLIRLEAIVYIIHMHDCKKCVQNNISKEIKRGKIR
jgi:hypothetical protein